MANHLFLSGSEDEQLFISETRKLEWRDMNDAAVAHIDTNAGDYGTALATYGEMVLYFKRNSTHALFGTRTENFELVNISNMLGCISDRSIAETNRAILWLAADGIYGYSGSALPTKASTPVQRFIDNMAEPETAAATTDGIKYYLSLKQNDDAWVLLVFDTQRGAWHVEDNPGFTLLFHLDGDIYGCTDSGFYKLESGYDSEVEWFFISKPFNFGQVGRLINLHKVYLDVTIDENAFIAAAYSNQITGDNFFPLTKYFSAGNGKIMFPLVPSMDSHNIKCFRLKLSGKGNCRIHGVEVGARVTNKAY